MLGSDPVGAMPTVPLTLSAQGTWVQPPGASTCITLPVSFSWGRFLVRGRLDRRSSCTCCGAVLLPGLVGAGVVTPSSHPRADCQSPGSLASGMTLTFSTGPEPQLATALALLVLEPCSQGLLVADPKRSLHPAMPLGECFVLFN